MEPRLMVAYTLTALMVAFVAGVIVHFSKGSLGYRRERRASKRAKVTPRLPQYR